LGAKKACNAGNERLRKPLVLVMGGKESPYFQLQGAKKVSRTGNGELRKPLMPATRG